MQMEMKTSQNARRIVLHLFKSVAFLSTIFRQTVAASENGKESAFINQVQKKVPSKLHW